MRRVPFVDCGVELQTRISAIPRGFRYLTPQVTSLHSTHWFACLDRSEGPLFTFNDCVHEIVGDTHRVVGILILHAE